MTIDDNEYGQFDVYLGDDGTMDTVIEVYNSSQFEGVREIRFGDTSHHRDNETGALADDGFKELAAESVEACIEQYLLC